MSWISSSDTSSGKNLARNLNWRGFSFLISWAETWGQRRQVSRVTNNRIHCFYTEKRIWVICLTRQVTVNSLPQFLSSGCLLAWERRKTLYVFQLSQENSVCTANLGQWKAWHHAVSDGKPLQHCMRLTQNSPLTLNRYITDHPSRKTVYTLVRTANPHTRAHQRHRRSVTTAQAWSDLSF